MVFGSFLSKNCKTWFLDISTEGCAFKYESAADRWDFKSYTYLEEQSIKPMHSALWINSAL